MFSVFSSKLLNFVNSRLGSFLLFFCYFGSFSLFLSATQKLLAVFASEASLLFVGRLGSFSVLFLLAVVNA